MSGRGGWQRLLEGHCCEPWGWVQNLQSSVVPTSSYPRVLSSGKDPGSPLHTLASIGDTTFGLLFHLAGTSPALSWELKGPARSWFATP